MTKPMYEMIETPKGGFSLIDRFSNRKYPVSDTSDHVHALYIILRNRDKYISKLKKRLRSS